MTAERTIELIRSALAMNDRSAVIVAAVKEALNQYDTHTQEGDHR